MASGQDIRITDVPFSSVPSTEATVFINDNGKLRQTDLTTIAKYSELYTAIIDAHNAGLQSLADTKAQLEQALINLANEKFELINTDHAENLAELTKLFEDSVQNLTALIESGHTKLENDIKTVDDLRTYSAMLRKEAFTKDASLVPTTKGNVLLDSVAGDSFQKQLSGKNLWSHGDVSGTRAETRALSLKAGTYTLSAITTSSDTDYTKSLMLFVYLDDTTKFVEIARDTRNSQTFELTSDVKYVNVYASNTSANSIDDTFTWSDIQIEAGSVATDYEPYCGGIPSPNPDYPQEIESVGDSGWFDGELAQGSFNTGVETTSTTSLRTGYIPVTVGDVIEITVKNALAYELFFYNKNKEYSMSQAMNASVYSFTVTSGDYIRFSIRYEDNTTITTNDDISVSVTINGQYATRIKTVGKNLLPNDYYDVDVVTGNGLTMTRQSDGSVVLNGTATANSAYRYCFNNEKNHDILKPYVGETVTINLTTTDSNVRYTIILYDKDGNQVLIKKTVTSAVTFVVPEEYATMRIYLWVGSGTIVTNAVASLQIELGSEATEYEPYTESTITIPLAEPLRAIGDVKDEICVQDGKYGVLRRIGSVVYDGSEDETWHAYTGSGYTNAVIYYTELESFALGYETSVCDHFSYRKAVWADSNISPGFYSDHNSVHRKYFAVDASYITADLFRTWLASNPVTVHYVLTTPTFKPFADQTPFYELMAHDGVTNISIVCGDNLNPSATVMYPSTEAGAVASTAYAVASTAYANSKKNKIGLDEIGATTHSYGDIGVEGKTRVTAMVVMQKLSTNKANIAINYRIVDNTSTDASDVNFISIARLKALLGLTGLSFNPWDTSVIIHETKVLSGTTLTEISPLYNPTYAGYSGYHACANAEAIFFGREYLNGPNFGGYGLTAPCYQVNLYGTINIWGADIT